MHNVSRRIKHAILIIAGVACLAGTVAPATHAQPNNGGGPDAATCEQWKRWAAEEAYAWYMAGNKRLRTEAFGRMAHWIKTARDAGCAWAQPARTAPPSSSGQMPAMQVQGVYVEPKKPTKPRPRMTTSTVAKAA